MKHMQKRLITVLLLMAMVLNMVGGVWATGEPADSSYVELYGTHINPLYADVITEADLVQPADDGIAAIAEPFSASSTEEAGVFLREEMKNRAETVTIEMESADSDSSSLLAEIIDTAFEHTGAPTEGDYLKWQYSGFGYRVSYSYSFATGLYTYTFTFTLTYYTTAAQEQEMDEKVAEVMAGLDLDGKSDYAKVSSIYEYICGHVVYDYDNLNDSDYKLKFSAYAALINGTSVCQGYAVLLYRMALAAGVDCRVITGTGTNSSGSGGHAWNIVKLGGKYYNVDSTWDATYYTVRGTYNYYLQCSDSFTGHDRDNDYTTDEFNALYPMSDEDYSGPSIADCTITLSGTEFTYDGTEIEPDVTVVDGSYTLVENTDYTLTYANNADVGTATVTIDGMGSYKGSVTREFTISEAKDNKCGENVYWELEDGVLTISGTGDMWDYNGIYEGPNSGINNSDTPWFDVRRSITKVDIEDGVTTIGECAFLDFQNLTSVTIPSSVTDIRFYAFVGCTSMNDIKIPDTVITIGNSVFAGCTGLTSVKIPDSVISLGDGVFGGCSALTSVSIPDGITSIGYSAFAYCDSLRDITIPDSVTSIGDAAFLYCASLTSINIPDGVDTIGYNAFYYCKGLTSITIPNSVTSIGKYAFTGCDNLTIYGYKGSTAETYANENDIPFIPLDAQADNKCGENVYWKLENGVLTIYGEGPMTDYECIRNDSTFSWESTAPWNNVKDAIETVIIDDGVTTIGDYAFFDCSSLTSVTIPNNVTSIGDDAFYDCTSLTNVEIPDSVTTIGYAAFADSGLTSITFPDTVTSIGQFVFECCFDLKSVTLPANLTTIPCGLFLGCKSLTDITIPDTVTSIESHAFEDCESLTSIKIPEGVTEIQYETFFGCTSLKSVTLPSTVTSIGYQAFCGCESLTSITLPDGLISIDASFIDCTSLTNITLPEGLTTIGFQSFLGCKSLTSINIPSTVTTIGPESFNGCGLTSVLIPATVTSIGQRMDIGGIPSFDPDVVIYGYINTAAEEYAGWAQHTFIPLDAKCGENVYWTLEDGTLTIFGEGDMWEYNSNFGWDTDTQATVYSNDAPWFEERDSIQEVVIGDGVTSIIGFCGLTNLTNVTLSDTVTTIGFLAFYGCESLTGIDIPDSVTTIGAYAFGSTGLTSVTIPASVTTMDWFIFIACSDLKSATLPAGLTTVPWGMFSGCKSLSDITIPDTVTFIDKRAFMDCYSLTSITIPEGVTAIDDYAFMTCKNLTSVTLPSTLIEIGIDAFCDCDSLESITIPENVEHFVDGFMYCKNLRRVTILSRNVSIPYAVPFGNKPVIYGYYGSTAETYVTEFNEINGDYLTFIPLDPSDNFIDVPKGQYYANAVVWAAGLSITKGTTTTTFSPDKTCTRGEIVKFLWNAAGQPEPTTTVNPFTDVKSTDHYYKAVLWAVENGIVFGKDATHFNPNGTCTRAEAMAFLWRSRGRLKPTSTSNSFTDVKKTDYFYDAVLWAVENNVTSGVGGGKFGSDQECTRGQIVTFLWNAAGRP